MSTTANRVFGTGFMLAMLLAAFATFAQDEAGDGELMPAVDTSAPIGPGDDELMPAVDTSVPVETVAAAENARLREEQDITRSATGSRVMDSIELGRTEITGNQELPKVLYIVPWQKSDPGELMGRPVNTLLDEVLAPLDREEFIRQVDYYGDLAGKDVGAASSRD